MADGQSTTLVVPFPRELQGLKGVESLRTREGVVLISSHTTGDNYEI
jgi:hypothetical protein